MAEKMRIITKEEQEEFGELYPARDRTPTDYGARCQSVAGDSAVTRCSRAPDHIGPHVLWQWGGAGKWMYPSQYWVN